jgi:predicted metal-dependent HD superfamily phosphohydrolase
LTGGDPLLERWVSLWGRLGIHDDALAPAGQLLIDAYDGPSRYYHTQTHLEDVLQKLDWARGAFDKSGDLDGLTVDERSRLLDTVELALWYHDAVYDPKRKDNEAKSRDMFLADAARFGLPKNISATIAAMIDVTANHRTAKTLSEKILCDCDLAILGAPKGVFDEYDKNIRKEYAHVPVAAYKIARRRVMGGFLDEKRLFKTKAFQEQFGARADANLETVARPVRTWVRSLFKGPSP